MVSGGSADTSQQVTHSVGGTYGTLYLNSCPVSINSSRMTAPLKGPVQASLNFTLSVSDARQA